MNVLLPSILALLQAAMTSSTVTYPDPRAPPPPSKTNPIVSYWRRQTYLQRVFLVSRMMQPPSGRSRQKHYVNPLVSTRSFSTMILHPDSGDCRTDISEGRLIYSAQHFVSRKTIDLAWPIKPKEIVCHSPQPANEAKGTCILVGYPHGAWVIYNLEDKNNLPNDQQDGCTQISSISNKFRCWDYVAVPGACVLKRS